MFNLTHKDHTGKTIINLDKAIENKKFSGHAPSNSHLHVFGSKCYIKIPDETQSKLDDKAKEF